MAVQTRPNPDHPLAHVLWDSEKQPVANEYVVDDSEDDALSESTSTCDPASRWRPKFHIMAAHGWMNDPCAPGYDPVADVYHVNFQWNPRGHVWGNMSWGSATSPNMIDWTISRTPSMVPTPGQDQHGVFTGAIQPRNEDACTSSSPHTLTAFYTSAQNSPIDHRLPYTRGSEKLALAASTDSGRTWTRDPQNIILAQPPTGYEVTSWRDPFVGAWRSLDELSIPRASRQSQYGILSGGLRGKTPTVFLYRIDPTCNSWTFLSPLVDLGLNYRPSRWTGGDFGVNFEVANFLTLSDVDGTTRDVLIASVEGTLDRDEGGGELSRSHRQMWMSGPLERSGDGFQMQFQYGGALDHGCFYAANGFWDPLTGHFVTYGWIFEDDLPTDLVANQGWSGCLSIARVVSLKTWKSVVGTTHTHPEKLTCFSSTQEQNGTYTMRTVSSAPDPRLCKSRVRTLSTHQLSCSNLCTFASGPSQLEMTLSLEVRDHARRVGFDILHSPDCSQYTRLYFDPLTETLVIDRSRSTKNPGIGVSPVQAPHTLFEFQHGERRRREDLEIHLFFDTSVIEVFVNERVVITTRVYPEHHGCHGISLYIESEEPSPGGAIHGVSRGKPQSRATNLRKCNIWELAGAVKYVD